VLILGGLEGEPGPPCASSEIGQHRIDLQSVDLGVIPAATVRGFLAATFPEQHQQILVVAAGLGGIVERLIILNPEGDVPGLPVCPSVEGLGGGGGGVHGGGLNCAHPTASRTHPVGPNLKKPERNPSANLIGHNAPERHQML
jgi:hypothetical protein